MVVSTTNDKKRKKSSSSSTNTTTTTTTTSTSTNNSILVRIREIEMGLEQGDVQQMNGITELLGHLRGLLDGSDENDAGLQSLHALRRIFLALVKKGDVHKTTTRTTTTTNTTTTTTTTTSSSTATASASAAQDKALQVYRRWVYGQYQAFLAALLDLVGNNSNKNAATSSKISLRVRAAALRTLMELVKVESIVYRKAHRVFGHALFYRLVARLAGAGAESETAELVEVLRVDYVQPYQDVRYWLLKSLRALADKDKDHKELKEQEDGQGEGPTTKSTRTTTLLKLLMLVVLEKSEADMIQFWVSFGGEEGDGTLVPRSEEEDEEVEENVREQQEEAEEDDDDDLMDFGYGDGDGDDEDDYDDDAQGDEEIAGAGGASGKEKIPHVAQMSTHRKALGEAWVACLRLPGFTPHLYRSTTQFVARHVIEAMASPLQLADFLTTSYAQGGLTSLVALEGLFVLMQVHNLEYPRFYASLYRLLSPQVLFSRHRPRFFRLLRLCLQSTHVPAHVVAAFLKKLSRLALQAPPPSIIFVLSLVIIVLRKHPACQALLHRTVDLGALAGARETDTFDPTAEDPALALKQQQMEGKTEGEGKGSKKGKGKGKGKGGKEQEKNSSAISGIQTSLWEVAALQSHYHPAVATLAKGLETSQPEDPKTLNPYSTMDEFYSYNDLFAHETKRRRVKKDVPLAFEKPVRAKELFQPGDAFGGIFALPSTSAVVVASAPASL